MSTKSYIALADARVPHQILFGNNDDSLIMHPEGDDNRERGSDTVVITYCYVCILEVMMQTHGLDVTDKILQLIIAAAPLCPCLP